MRRGSRGVGAFPGKRSFPSLRLPGGEAIKSSLDLEIQMIGQLEQHEIIRQINTRENLRIVGNQ